MLSTLKVLLLFLLPVCQHAACPVPYTVLSGQCVYISNFTAPWCSAAAYCLFIGGELVTELPAILAINKLKSFVFTGVTDLLVEQRRSRLGWRFTNGSIFPTLENSEWKHLMPSNSSLDDDVLAISTDGLTDAEVSKSYYFACQPIVTPKTGWLRRQDFLRLGNISSVYCYTDWDIAGGSHAACLWLCGRRWECRAALFNTATGACRMLDFADASVGDEIETNPAWVKYAKQYE